MDGSGPPAAGSGGSGGAQACEPAAPAEAPVADKGRNAEVDFHGQSARTTHASITDPDARLYRKGDGKEAKALLYGPCPDGEPQRPCGRSLPQPRGRPRRRNAALAMIEPRADRAVRITLGADKG